MSTYTLTELVERTGFSARTIRFYTGRGLLPAPGRVGRQASYEDAHLVRLELVRELQQHGLTLSAIEDYLERIPAQSSPETVALHRTLLSPWISEPTERLTLAQLDERAGRPLSPDDREVLQSLGIITRVGRGYEVTAALLPFGADILDLGLPPEAAAAAGDVLAEHGRAVAEQLTDIFRTEVWPAYKDSGLPPEVLESLVQRFKPVTFAALLAHYSSAVDELKKQTVRAKSRPARSTAG